MPDNIQFKPFHDFIRNKTLKRVRDRHNDSNIRNIEVYDDNKISATVFGTQLYNVHVIYNSRKVTDSSCSCPYEGFGACKHIVHVLVSADQLLLKKQMENYSSLLVQKEGGFLIPDKKWNDIDDDLYQQLKKLNKPSRNTYFSYHYWSEGSYLPDKIDAQFVNDGQLNMLLIEQREDGIFLQCSCNNRSGFLCSDLLKVLETRHSDVCKIAFDPEKRETLLKKEASKYNWNLTTMNLEELFQFKVQGHQVLVEPKLNFVNPDSPFLEKDKQFLLQPPVLPWETSSDEIEQIIVVKYNRFEGFYRLTLMQAKVSKNGGLKSPIFEVPDHDLLNQNSNPDELNFYQGLVKLARWRYVNVESPEFDKLFDSYKAILKNPLNLSVFFFDDDGGKVTPQKLEPINTHLISVYPRVEIHQKGDFFEVSSTFEFNGKNVSSKSLNLKSLLFFRENENYYLFDSKLAIRLYYYFLKNKHRLFVHKDQFDAYRENFLSALESHVTVKYSFIQKPQKKERQKEVQQNVPEKRIYLTESEDYILLTPAVGYGDSEIPLFSRRMVYQTLPDGSREEIQRNEWLERSFTRFLDDLHSDFDEQDGHEFYYLHRQEFLESGWFLDAFEKLREENIQIFGFSQLSKNRLNPHSATISTQVSSGIDWFDIHTTVKFGDQEVGLKDLQKAIYKKDKYIELGDGTQGLLPEKWIEKFGQFFRSSDIHNNALRVHKGNFQLIDEYFRNEVLDQEIRMELHTLTDKLANFQSISNTRIPLKLKATLRDYQKEGLNWLNFLDEYGFGGCLADDMGLGKTLQIITYILLQHEKGRTGVNLIIVPTSLIFNWRNEILKFAPHLQVCELYGAKRNTANICFEDYDLIITSYGTLLSDIDFLKRKEFNLIVLDESQSIKNPASKRYKAVRLLQGRQRLVLTGTPIENNTFDLYAQLSFTIPGLLGSVRQFQELYATPIDKFGDKPRSKELQRKIHPFVLRRTKKQVAKELPEKTEMVIYCELGQQQRKLYDTYKKEFQELLKGNNDAFVRKNPTLILQGMMKLRQICNSSAILGDKEDYGYESAKIDELMTQIEEKKDEHKILVFSQFVTMLDQIRKELNNRSINYCYLTGETRNRQEQVDQFQNDDETRVFLISLKAGGTGLNLTKADYVFLVDPWWNPAVENQAIDRAYRIGQEKHVVAIRLITPDTIEEKIMHLQEKKKQLSDELIHTDNAIMKQLSKDDLLGIV